MGRFGRLLWQFSHLGVVGVALAWVKRDWESRGLFLLTDLAVQRYWLLDCADGIRSLQEGCYYFQRIGIMTSIVLVFVLGQGRWNEARGDTAFC